MPATSAIPTAGAEVAASARHGTGVDARDMPAALRVGPLKDDDIDHIKMEFPGTYNRRGRMNGRRVEAIEGEGRRRPAHPDIAAEIEDIEDEVELLEELFPFSLSG